jgi:hypothetical protein
MNSVQARPIVEQIVTKKPIMIEFFLPRVSNINPTTGEKIRAATSKDVTMKATSISPSDSW